MCFPFVALSPTPSAPEDASIEKPIASSPADGETTMGVVEESPIARVAEEVVASEVVATTTKIVATTAEVVMETAEEAVEASGQGGDVPSHRVGKEVVADVPSDLQREAAVTESEDEEYFNFCTDFFGPASIVGSSAFRSRNWVPHPKDIPNRGEIFDNKRLEKVWWDQVVKIDKLKSLMMVFSMFAWTTMNVSI